MTDIALAGIRKIIAQIGKNKPDIMRLAPGVVMERVTDKDERNLCEDARREDGGRAWQDVDDDLNEGEF